jgi:hypothetical protein
MDHIGIDVHKRASQIYILAEDGEIIERQSNVLASLRSGRAYKSPSRIGPRSNGLSGTRRLECG